MIRVLLALALAIVAAAWIFSRWQARVIARTHPPSGAFTELEGDARLHFTERRPAGPVRNTVVLLHGASGNQADLMLPLGDRLASLGFRVVAPDRPGHGWSGRPGGEADASPTRQADLLRTALDRIGVTHGIVVGHSWSGALAATFALDHPDFVDGLVLLSPVLYPWEGGIAWYYDRVATPWVGPIFTRLATVPLGMLLFEAGVAEVFAPQSSPEDFAARTGTYLLLRPSEFVANAQDVRALHGFVSRQAPRLREIAAPTAIVAGDEDRVVASHAQAARAATDIPGASLAILYGVGHSPHWAEPDRVVAAIIEVADRAETAGPAAVRQAEAQ